MKEKISFLHFGIGGSRGKKRKNFEKIKIVGFKPKRSKFENLILFLSKRYSDTKKKFS